MVMVPRDDGLVRLWRDGLIGKLKIASVILDAYKNAKIVLSLLLGFAALYPTYGFK